MQDKTSRRALFLLLAGLWLALTSCASLEPSPADRGRWRGKAVYTRVGMHAEASKAFVGWHMYSTNHIGLPKFFPLGSKFTVTVFGPSSVSMVAEDGSVVELDYVPRHHPDLTFDRWLERQLSFEPIEAPSGLSSEERTAIAEGRYVQGMSRKALFLSVGYPPATLSPNLNDALLTYEVKRFNRVMFQFDAQDKITEIRH